MKQNHPTPGWPGKGIPAIREGPEKYDDTTWPTRDGPETRIRDGTHSEPANSDSPIHERTENRARDGTVTRIRDGTVTHIRDGTVTHIRAGDADIAVGFSQRNRHTHAQTGLQPHEENMRLKQGLSYFNLIRQLPACRTGRKQTAMDNLYSPNLEGFGNLKGLKSCWFGTQTLTGQKDAVRFTKKVAALDSTASARWRTDNVNCTGLKSFDTLLHNPVCRKRRRDDTEIRIRDGTPVRIRDDTEIRTRDGTWINPSDGTTNRARDGTFLREKIPKEPALKRKGKGKLCTDNAVVKTDDAGKTGKIRGKVGKIPGMIDPPPGRACQPPGRTDKNSWRGGRQTWKCLQPELEELACLDFIRQLPACRRKHIINADRSNDAVRFRDATDLSACAAPDNVNEKIKGNIN